jgi:hypothetical protein
VFLQLGKDNGTLGVPKVVTELPYGGASIAVGHFNADTHLDLVIGHNGTTSIGVRLLPGKGNGTFGRGRTFVAGTAISGVAMADFNADGKADIVATQSLTNTFKVLLGTGTGAFHAPQSFSTGASVKGLAVADFNGDGFPDLAVNHTNSLSVLLNDGNWI